MSRARTSSSLALAAAALVCSSAIGFSACFDDGTTVCKNGLRCPPGLQCTANGNQCTNNLCGNGVEDPGEACDDGNIEPGDDCSPYCTWTSDCGDGYVDLDGNNEECDCGALPQLTREDECEGEPNDNDEGYCNLSCRTNCNDGELDLDEECDASAFRRTFRTTCISEGYDRGAPSCSVRCQVALDDCRYIGWREVETGTSQVGSLTDVWQTGAGTMFAVGDSEGHGVVMESTNGGGWTEVYVHESAPLSGVWGTNGNDIFVAGTDGVILRYDNAGWSVFHELEGPPLRSVWGAGFGSDIWVAGDEGALWRYDRRGDLWQREELVDDLGQAVTTDLNDLWGGDAGDFYVVGRDGLILHKADGAWVREAEGLTRNDLLVVWGIGGRVFAAGDLGTLLVRDQGVWTLTETNARQDVYSLWGRSVDRVFAVGRRGTAHLFDGQSWMPLRPADKEPNFEAVVPDGGTGVHAVDRNGGRWRYSGETWMAGGTPPSEQHVRAVWADRSADLYAAVSTGEILRFDGYRWTELLSEPLAPSLHGIWGTPDGELYAVGGDSSILQRDTSGAWSLVSLPPEVPKRQLRGIWGSDDGHLFVVGDVDPNDVTENALVLVRIDGVWSAMTTPAQGSLRAVWGNSESDVYAVGENRTIVHWNGIEWEDSLPSVGDETTLHAIWGSGPNDIHAVGDHGIIYRRDGRNWIPDTVDPVTLRGVWSSGPEDVYVVGDGGLILYFNGETWSPVNSQTSERLLAIRGTGNYSGSTQLLHFAGENAAFFQLAVRRSPGVLQSR